MKHRLLFAAAATALLAPSLASAQDSGVYLKGQLGYGVTEDATLGSELGTNAGAQFTGDVGGEGDLAYGLGLGYDFGDNWRIEGEWTQLFTDFGTIGGQPNTLAKLRTDNIMANLLYDFSDFGAFTPYVGAGIGIVSSKLNLSAHDIASPLGTVVANPACVSLPTPGAVRECSISDDQSNLGFQLLAGLGFDITDNLTWDTNYRYVDGGEIKVEGEQQTIRPGQGVTQTNAAIADFEDLAQHMVMTGFRYRFGESTPDIPVFVAPPPAPMVTCWDGSEASSAALCPPEPVIETFTCWDGVTTVTDLAICPPQPVMMTCPDGVTQVSDIDACPIVGDMLPSQLCAEEFRQEIIYYEFNKGQSAETRNTINRILDLGQFCQVSNIRVVGHTDTSGAASYNLNLSKRRAADAREELVRQGINSAIITSEGKGETEPFVPTGDGVKEQLNRRTEVLIQLSEVGTGQFN